jgi:hypothetical protein
LGVEGFELDEEEVAEAESSPIADIGDRSIRRKGFERVEDIPPDTTGAEAVALPQVEVTEDQAGEGMAALAVEGGTQAALSAGFVTILQVEHGLEVMGVSHEGVEAEGGIEFLAGTLRLAEVGIDAAAQDVRSGILAFVEDEAGEEMFGIGVALETDGFDGAGVEGIPNEDFSGGHARPLTRSVVDGAGRFDSRAGSFLVDDCAGKEMRDPQGAVGAEGFRLP